MKAYKTEDLTVVGQITSVYGVKGWLKIYSHTDPKESILNYKPWLIQRDGQWVPVNIETSRKHGKGLVAKLEKVDDRDVARQYCGIDIAIERSQLPVLDTGEYYWSQLEQLTVYTLTDQVLGKVSHLIETGSNDVLVVKGDSNSIDDKERMIPYLPDQVVKEINLETGSIRVDWDPEF
ncbi:MAG: ribosome maturation factor RimM [Oceanospirillaceae bacterium]|nr:ribosome maturation factor RimM [Oceanospirillaceae bacterium]